MNKHEAIKNYLMGQGNYDFPFDKYLDSVERATGNRLHPFVWYCEFFYDQPMFPGTLETMGYDAFAKLVKSSPEFNPDDHYIWFGDDGKLHSANHIYPDIYDAEKVATWCVEHNDDLDWDDDIHEILFGKGNEHED